MKGTGNGGGTSVLGCMRLIAFLLQANASDKHDQRFLGTSPRGCTVPLRDYRGKEWERVRVRLKIGFFFPVVALPFNRDRDREKR